MQINILPFEGINILSFGDSRQEVTKKMLPYASTQNNESDKVYYHCWDMVVHYQKNRLVFIEFFNDPEDNNFSITYNDIKFINRNITDVIYDLHLFDDKPVEDEFKTITFFKIGLLVSIDENIVKTVAIFHRDYNALFLA